MHRFTILTTIILAFFFVQKSPAADVNFAQQIQPIFMENCAGCHGEKKGLGRLRLHSAQAIQEKWQADEHLIVKGNPGKSELYERLVLPADHKKFMPKKGKPLSEEKLVLIRAWIEQGAAFSVVAVGETASDADESHDDSGHGEHAAEPDEIPLPEVAAADPSAIEKLAEAGAQVSPIYAGSLLLHVSFGLRVEPATDAEVALLDGVAEQVYTLNLSKAQLTDDGLASVGKLKNLAQLHLENSSVTDRGLAKLAGLANLQYLNLYGTEISDVGLKSIEDLPNLRKLYLWQTKVSYDLAKSLEKSRAGLTADLGFDHPVVKRKRLEKQLEQAKQSSEAAKADFETAKTALERAKQGQEKSKQRLDELQKELDGLNGAAEPDQKPTAPPADKVAAADAKG